MIRKIIPPIHKEGYYFIIIFAFVSIVMGCMHAPLGYVGFLLTSWCVYFFRDPVRITPIGNFIISPADGVVQKITRAIPPEELEMGLAEMTRISIFLSVCDVHVNRVPAEGVIKKLCYHPGKFINAELDKASIHNERQSVLMVTKDNQEIAFVQIAGLIARRIICTLEENQEVKAGERFGIIRFGSRMDIYLPDGMCPAVVEGQYSIGGETILADLDSAMTSPRTGEIR